MTKLKFGLTIPQGWWSDLPTNDPIKQYEFSKKISKLGIFLSRNQFRTSKTLKNISQAMKLLQQYYNRESLFGADVR